VSIPLFERVVLTRDLPADHLRAGDVGVIVEHYAPRGGAPEGYEVEFFAASGDTVAVVSIAAADLRTATEHEILSVREFARAG
jgi:hypothetical protein